MPMEARPLLRTSTSIDHSDGDDVSIIGLYCRFKICTIDQQDLSLNMT
jgi:hypothetical protein